MNFKPDIWKSITSLVSGIVANYYVAVINGPQLCDCNDITCWCIKSRWVDRAFDSGPLIVSIAIIVIIYLIWSLIQKK